MTVVRCGRMVTQFPPGVSSWVLAQVMPGFKTECSKRQEGKLPVPSVLGLASNTMGTLVTEEHTKPRCDVGVFRWRSRDS